MPRVRVFNENKFVHTERFKGDVITIQPGKFVEMDKFEAIEFMGQFTAPRLNHDDIPMPESYKMLKMVEISSDEPVVEPPRFIHPVTGQSYDTAEELSAALDEIKDRVLVDEEAEVAIKRSPGRPRKAS